MIICLAIVFHDHASSIEEAEAHEFVSISDSSSRHSNSIKLSEMNKCELEIQKLTLQILNAKIVAELTNCIPELQQPFRDVMERTLETLEKTAYHNNSFMRHDDVHISCKMAFTQLFLREYKIILRIA